MLERGIPGSMSAGRRGIPGVMIATTAFQQAAAAQSASLGYEPAIVWVPHPIQNRTDEEITDRAIADEAGMVAEEIDVVEAHPRAELFDTWRRSEEGRCTSCRRTGYAKVALHHRMLHLEPECWKMNADEPVSEARHVGRVMWSSRDGIALSTSSDVLVISAY